ncbi:MAG: hypothetical protein PHT40_00160 [Patescibacteria group bacterium]|nr:hypothetical protein [Patescibacteria group bacterium]
MLNIMMIGFNRHEAKKMKKKIDDAVIFVKFMAGSYDNDIVITSRLRYSDVRSCDGKNRRMPYLIICSTKGLEQIDRIIQALKIRKVSVGCIKMPLLPDGFIPADQMK